MINLTAELVEAFAGTFLSPIYDNPCPTPEFHREGWKLYCSDTPRASIAAPRSHAKSTAFTHTFGLAVALFRVEDFILIVSATEDLAIGHLGDIAKEFRENEELREHFQIDKLLVDAKTDIIVQFKDGHQCRFLCKGSGQKMRGMKWRGKRPGLILGDDLEEDEQVESVDRRLKFRKWVFRALIPCLRKSGRVRFHGTILDEDSMLARLQRSPSWSTLLFRAHAAFDDFSQILWPEAFDEARLRDLRQGFIDQGDASGYSQEYLNDPYDSADAFLRKEDFLPMRERDFDSAQVFKCGVDFAVSKNDRANRTSFTVGGRDTSQLIHIRDEIVGRFGPEQWVEMFFAIDKRWGVDEFIVEGGTIWKAIQHIIYNEMRDRGHYLSIRVINPVGDKSVRARPLQKAHRAGVMRFDKEASWYQGYESELLRFTGKADALRDDQFDSTAILMMGFEQAAETVPEDFFTEEDWSFRRNNPRAQLGRNAVTGY